MSGTPCRRCRFELASLPAEAWARAQAAADSLLPRELADHLRDCDACRRFAAECAAQDAALLRTAEPAPEELARRLTQDWRTRVASTAPPRTAGLSLGPRPPHHSPPRPISALAAALAACLGLVAAALVPESWLETAARTASGWTLPAAVLSPPTWSGATPSGWPEPLETLRTLRGLGSTLASPLLELAPSGPALAAADSGWHLAAVSPALSLVPTDLATLSATSGSLFTLTLIVGGLFVLGPSRPRTSRPGRRFPS